MFEWLFKYPSNVWQEASLGFENGWPPWILAATFFVVLLILAYSLWRKPMVFGRRSLVFTLQALVAAILLAMVWQPALRVEIAEQGENTVAWIVDISQSMGTEDVPLDPRSTAQQQSRLSAAQSIVSELALDKAAEFDAALYAQGASLQAVSTLEQLAESEPSSVTDLAGGLDDLLGTVGENALAAVVLMSDGSHNTDAIDAQWWQRLSAAGVPVHTVGLGRLTNPADIQLSDVVIPDQAAPDVQLTARLTVAHSIGASARVRILSGRDLIATQDIELPQGVTQSVHEVSLPSGDEGIRRLRFEVLSNEAVSDPFPANNVQPRMLRVADAPKRILYVEGEPRWEYKFLRRALESYPGVEIVSLLRTSPNKFYRQGVRDASELADGFPVSREELFAYDALIIGSLEAAEMNTAQQLAVRGFVSERGGSLLMLAGRHGLADGGWGRSLVSAALPVILDARLAAETFRRVRSQAQPTISGFRTPWLSLGESQEENQIAWQGLPALADAQSLGAVKPGAVVLLEQGEPGANNIPAEPLLVMQRYGKGQSVVLGTSGTWRWQMGLDSNDQRHERFWQQLTSMLVESVVPRISIATTEPVYRDVDSADITVNAYSTDYEPLQQATLPVQVSLPDGSVLPVELQADTQLPGVYSGPLEMPFDGPYTVTAMTPLGGESPQSSLVTSEQWWVRESGTAESFDNSLQADFLQRVADATGGSYLAANEVEQLIDVLAQKNAALKREVSLPLWNMPILFLGLLLFKSLEWLLRLRWKRL